MKFLVFILIICGISLSLGQMLDNDPQGRACVPNSTFTDRDGCNRCVCTNDGQRYACTKRFCPKIPDNVQSDEPMDCEPGSRFKAADGCNWCTCSDDGKNSFCTLMACVGKQSEYAPMPYRRKRDDSCVPNSSFLAQDGCNTCHCNADGTAAFCTRMECPPKATPYRKKRDTDCEPGSRFKAADGCNWCTCSDNGKNAMCTLMACVGGQSEYAPVPRVRRKRNDNCVPGSTFLAQDGCNTCTCSADGTAAFCTRMECPPKATPYRKRRDSGN
uniref:Putative serine protease inhibitor i/ii n=1 Tax=Phlebotomus kandelakii TaxID=1109342 RepID=A0A6B2EFK1_9DIPT